MTDTTRLSKNRTHANRRLVGLCASCGLVASEKYRCGECRRALNAEVNERRRMRKDSGLCIFCGDEALPESVRCLRCKKRSS